MAAAKDAATLVDIRDRFSRFAYLLEEDGIGATPWPSLRDAAAGLRDIVDDLDTYLNAHVAAAAPTAGGEP